ncbi:hypothetical protein [Oceanicella sp. SM1341]|uniref:hypothetical protein n=1 Tax=Oceanicella sp. SM1341 TaxID=1548889 RepID=UPI001300BD63|nr:hypothetical protein [Oceanicella sp. SM1341]
MRPLIAALLTALALLAACAAPPPGSRCPPAHEGPKDGGIGGTGAAAPACG